MYICVDFDGTVVDHRYPEIGEPVPAAIKWLLRIQATVLESNERSLRVLQRCAFEREGYLRSYRQIRGRAGNFWLYARLAGVP